MTSQESSYREIPLTKGFVALVDISDYEILSQWKWHAANSKNKPNFYASRKIWIGRINGVKKMTNVSMHRFILGLADSDKRFGDHINGNTLDNRRCNLRIATPSENNMNSVLRKDNVSGCRGVFWNKLNRKWRARIAVYGKNIEIGSFESKEEAIAARKKVEIEYFGEFIRP